MKATVGFRSVALALVLAALLAPAARASSTSMDRAVVAVEKAMSGEDVRPLARPHDGLPPRELLDSLSARALDEAAIELPIRNASAGSPESYFASDTSVERKMSIYVGQGETLNLPNDVGNVMVVDDNIADAVVASARQIHLIGKMPGSTDIKIVDTEGRTMMALDIKVGTDIGPLRKALKQYLPGEDIAVEAIGSNIYLSGTVSSPGAITDARTIARRFAPDDESVINMVRLVGENQVLIKVKVAEVERSVVKEIGNSFNFISGTGLGSGLGSPPAQGTALGLGVDGAVQFFRGTSLWGGAVETLLSAMENEGLVRTLAEPNLTAISGKSAQMLAGGQIPIPVPRDGTVGFEYRDFGVALNFVPTVMSAGNIALDVSTEVSSVSAANSISISGTTVPSFNVRRASTSVELPSGGSIMIAGLLQNEIQNAIKGMPGAKEIPVLGQLFRSNAFQRNESELVIIVTAYVVKPTSMENMSAPTNGFQPPSDADMFLLGKLSGGDASTLPPSVASKFGFIVE